MDIHINDVLKKNIVKIRVKGLRVFKLRFWLGWHVLKLGAWITGVTHIAMEED